MVTSRRSRQRPASISVALVVGAALALVAHSGCGENPLGLGAAPEVIWWTDHETGDFTDWDSPDVLIGKHWVLNGDVLVVPDQAARSGRNVMRSTITTMGVGLGISGACAQKEGELPREAYYSAWFYIPTPRPTPTVWWIGFKFRSRTLPSDSTTQVDVWDVNFEQRTDGQLGLSIFSHLSRTSTPIESGPIVPVGAWFQIEAFLRVSQDQSGRLDVWLNDQPAPSFDGQTMPSDYVEWSVGGISESLIPATGTLLVDDAAITTRRLGSRTAPFWRGAR